MKNFNKTIFTAILLVVLMSGRVAFAAGPTLGTAGNFAVLAGSAITNTGSSVINGDLGLSPGTSVSGFPPGILNGVQHVADAPAAGAKADLVNAYNYAYGQLPVYRISTELGGSLINRGVYDSADGTFGLTGTLTLDALGDPAAVFIFKSSTTLITAASSRVVLAGGAQACNVFWLVGSSATLGSNSTFKGSILALTSVTLTTGAQVEGRILARNGAVTIDSGAVTKAECAAPAAPVATSVSTSTPATAATSTPNVVLNFTSTSTPGLAFSLGLQMPTSTVLAQVSILPVTGIDLSIGMLWKIIIPFSLVLLLLLFYPIPKKQNE